MENQEKENSSSPKPTTPRPPPPTESNQYPTTFVQADTSSFKQVVQMLTGSAETAAAAANGPKNPNPIPPKANGPKKQAFKLYERRNSHKNLTAISPLTSFQHHHPTAFSPRKQQQQQPTEIFSPSTLDFPSLVLSPVTPLIPDPFNRTTVAAAAAAAAAEEKAIAEKGFYLHPSPRGSNKDSEPPRLLPLFPVTSPRASTSQ